MRLPIIGLLAILVCNVACSQKDNSSHSLKSGTKPSAYDAGGPYKLEHFRLTKGRTDLREFLWRHWHDHIPGTAEAQVGTVDVGTVSEIYLIHPDAKGQWGIDIEIRRPLEPPTPMPRTSTFHAGALVRVLIQNPDEDYPSQTLGPYWPDRTVPQRYRMADSEIKDPKFYTIILMENEKAIGDTI